MVRVVFLFTALLAACAPPPPAPAPKPRSNPTAESWYAPGVAELTAIVKDAQSLFAAGKMDDAAAAITRAQPLENRLLSVPQPTLAAMQAASDLDLLYGKMLMKNGRYGYALLEFQKDSIRWKSWRPETAETKQRYESARSLMADCDRRLAQ